MMKKILKVLTGVPVTVVSGAFLGWSLLLLLTGWKFRFDPVFFTIALSGIPLVYGALDELFRKHTISSDLLVSIAMAACLSLGEYFAAGEVAFIMMLGAMLEEMTVARAQKGLQQLIALEPQECRVIRNGAERILPVEAVVSGDTVRILPGETIPVDGTVVLGESSVDQSAMTGESLPVDKAVGDDVLSGSVNCFGVMEIQAAKTGENSSIQKLIRMVREAEKKKAPTQRIVDQWASWMVPAAIAISLVTYWATGDVIRAVTVLVVFCPCAFVLATPTAIMAAIGQATKFGVLVKSGEALENMGRSDVIAFDKTGTLTRGRLEVSELVPADKSVSPEELLRLAACAELRSEHPLGKAIVAYAGTHNVIPPEPESFSMISGKGLSVSAGESHIVCGNRNFLEEHNIVPDAEQEAILQNIHQQGKAVVAVGCNGKLIGFIALSDVLRPDAPKAIKKLNELGAETVLLTGDHAGTAAFFAEQAGIPAIYSELLPAQKENVVERFQRQNRKVCMIGDGINDAPALKAASVGVAMGTMGSDIAVEAADIALLGDDLMKIPYLKALSNAVIRAIKVNIVLSMGINGVAIVLSVMGFLGPISGALVHNAGSVLVILNAALLYDRNFCTEK